MIGLGGKLGTLSSTDVESGNSKMRASSVLSVGFVVMVVAVVLAGFAATAHAEFGVASFDGAVTADETGDVSFTQAGGHPFAVSTSFAINTHSDPVYGNPWPDEPIKDVLVDAPPGLVGNPTAGARCTLGELVRTTGCQSAAQVGTVNVVHTGCPAPGFCLPFSGPIGLFSMVPPPGVPARFAFQVSGTIVTLDAEVRSGPDYGLSVNAKYLSEGLAVTATTVTLWGVPADPAHDASRRCHGSGDIYGCGAGVPPQAFMSLPSACVGPLTTTLHTDSWFHPGDFVSASFISHLTAAEGGAPTGVTGCDLVPFDGAFDARPREAVSPGASGWSFDLTVPQDEIADPEGIAQSALKKAVVTLPEGVRVSPSAADGLGACSPAQIDLDSSSDPLCPDASKLGSVTVDTPLLEEPLSGSVFLATPHDNPSGSLIAMYLVVQGQGVTVKLPGSVVLDPSTGRISAVFDNNPQLPFSRVHLEFFGGTRAALSNPPRCGTYTTHAELTSWSGKTVESESSFTTSRDGQGALCPAAKFDPAFRAGTVGSGGQVPTGGSFSSFVMNLSRTDDDQEFAAVQSLRMPDGLLARIAGVPLCGASDSAAGTCGEGSRVGSVTTTAGPGTNPFAVPGRVYLAGPYKGAPFSLSIVVPAVAGPFDLGTVVVRSALAIDPATAKVDVRTDPLPTILQGVPLQVRTVNVAIDRPGFVLNPTSCAEKQIGASVESTEGSTANVGSRFQVAECASLAFAPRLGLRLTGRKQTRTGRHPGVKAVVRQTGLGEAGIRKAVVRLPKSLALDPSNANALCEFEDGTKPDLENHCPKGSIVGRARAVTPLLAKPLAGNVYFVKNVRRDRRTGNSIRTLPMIVVALRGEIAINLKGVSSTTGGGQLVNTFATVPDAPITKFNLNIKGGNNGILAVTQTAQGKIDLCGASRNSQIAQVAMNGQNGKQRNTRTQVKTPCANKPQQRLNLRR